MSIKNFLPLSLASLLLALVGTQAAWAAPVTFTATGNPNVVGFVQFDDATFSGSSFQLVSNSEITALSLNVFGSIFTLADVDGGAQTIIDSSGIVPLIVNGNGLIAFNGVSGIAFYPDDYNSSGLDGDASLGFGAGTGHSGYTFYQVGWDATAPPSVPEPSTMLLLGGGFLALASMRRRKQS